jgi:hypothetical protein
MLEKEKIIKEQRLAEATDKNYIGLDGKFGIILKGLGHPIISQNSGFYEVTDWQDVYDYPEEDELPTNDPDAPIREIGKIFDGLKLGLHLEISYLKDGMVPVLINKDQISYEPFAKVLKVSYKGYVVYLEAENDLIIYLPDEEWESHIKRIYESAEKIQRHKVIEGRIIEQEELKEQKLSFLQRLRERWGI